MYFITCFQRYEPNYRIGVPDIGSARTVGYYKDKDIAIKAVKGNSCYMDERVYRYAVIESIPEGLYQLAIERIFFKWNEEQEVFEMIDPLIDNWGNYAFG
jgi:hypothetical protein